MEEIKPWGKALKNLLLASGLSQNVMVKRAKIENNEFYRMCRGPRGPGTKQLDKVLRAMGMTWYDWAEAFESVNTHKAHPLAAESRASYRTGDDPPDTINLNIHLPPLLEVRNKRGAELKKHLSEITLDQLFPNTDELTKQLRRAANPKNSRK